MAHGPTSSQPNYCKAKYMVTVEQEMKIADISGGSTTSNNACIRKILWFWCFKFFKFEFKARLVSTCISDKIKFCFCEKKKSVVSM